tara:strand:+ start:991 stop:1608 length:618 start_codon:yes stop_codon:yes gene_type:complete
MTPIRKPEQEFLLDMANKKFRNKAQSVDSEIQSKAQELADKKKPGFQKLVKVDKKMVTLIEAEKKYKKHLQSKDAIERKLLDDVRKKAQEVSEHLSRVKNVRNWNGVRFDDYSSRHEIDDQASDHFMSELSDACYKESHKHIEDNHEIRNNLESKRELVMSIIYSGASLQSIQGELFKAYKSSGIEYYLPSTLLALPTTTQQASS